MVENKQKRPQKFTATYIKKMQEQHNEDRDKWAFYIGHVVLVFTEIEDHTLSTIRRAFPSFCEFSKTLLLEKRLDLLATILDSGEGLTDDVKNAVNVAIEKIKKLAAKRNLIVHNSVRLTIVANAADRVVLSAGGLITSARNEEKKMDLRQLEDFLNEVRECYVEFYKAGNMVVKQIWDVQEVRRKRERRRETAALRRAAKNPTT